MNRFQKRRARIKIEPLCPDCAGTGFKPAEWRSQLTGRTIRGVRPCHCRRVIQLAKPLDLRRQLALDRKQIAGGGQ